MLIAYRDSSRIEYKTRTTAGTLRFDNVAARAIAARLDDGPASLTEVATTCEECTEADLLNALDALLTSGDAVVSDAPDPRRDVRFEQIEEVLADPDTCRRLGTPALAVEMT